MYIKRKILKNTFQKKKELLVYVIIAIFFTLIGIFLHRNGLVSFAKIFLLSDTNNKIIITKNILSSPFVKIDKLYLDIDFESFKQLNQNRKIAISKNILLKEYNQNVNASIRHDNKTVPVRIKLKGGILSNHLGENWSFKVRTKKSNILGLNDFALMHAQRRNFLLEWYARKMYQHEGIIFKDYKYINLYVNGESKGIYVMDENYSEALAVKNNRNEGIFIRYGTDINFTSSGVRGDEISNDEIMYQFDLKGCCGYDDNLQATNIDVLNDQISSLTKKEKIKNYFIAKKYLEDFRSNKVGPEKIFDIDLMSKAFALSDLLGSWHNMHWGNLKFYFNPFTRRLEPVLDDSYDEKTAGFTKFNQKIRGMRIYDSYNHNLLNRNLFNSKIFVKKYIFYLDKYSKKDFLIEFEKKIEKEFNKNLKYINKFEPQYIFPHHVIEENRKRIEAFLQPHNALFVSLWKTNESGLTLKLGNTSMLPLSIKDIYIVENDTKTTKINIENKIFNEFNFLYPRYFKKPINYKFLNLDIKTYEKISEISVSYKIDGTDTIRTNKIINPLPTSDIEKIEISNEIDTTMLFDNLDIFENKILIKSGHFQISKDLIIPKNKELIISAGSMIDLINNSKIISYSRILAEGTLDSPILITSSDNSGQCIFTLNDKRVSIFKNMHFSNLSNCSDSMIELRGSVNFYNTDIQMDNIYFYNNIKGDDYLNIVDSNFLLKNLEFHNSRADALDIDYSKGTISNIKIINALNDGMDLSNSSIELKNLLAENIGDKAISIGENSYLFGYNIDINSSFLGIAVKDQSDLELENVKISNSDIGIASYIKKHEYDPAKIKIRNLKNLNNSKNFEFEKGSNIIIENLDYTDFKDNVFELIYPGLD